MEKQVAISVNTKSNHIQRVAQVYINMLQGRRGHLLGNYYNTKIHKHMIRLVHNGRIE